MDAMELFSKSLLTYDNRVGLNDMFYYSLPYERNYALTTSIPIAPYSGNIIKFYQYKVDKPVIIFTDTVDIDYESLGTSSDGSEFDEEYGDYEDADADGETKELSDEEMAALLTADSGTDEEITDDEFADEATDMADVPVDSAPAVDDSESPVVADPTADDYDDYDFESFDDE